MADCLPSSVRSPRWPTAHLQCDRSPTTTFEHDTGSILTKIPWYHHMEQRVAVRRAGAARPGQAGPPCIFTRCSSPDLTGRGGPHRLLYQSPEAAASQTSTHHYRSSVVPDYLHGCKPASAGGYPNGGPWNKLVAALLGLKRLTHSLVWAGELGPLTFRLSVLAPSKTSENLK